jgi:hypothetical protein
MAKPGSVAGLEVRGTRVAAGDREDNGANVSQNERAMIGCQGGVALLRRWSERLAAM